MTLSGIPAHLLAFAAADPRNAHAREALERLAGVASPAVPPEPASVPQRGAESVRAPGKRRGVPNKTEARFARDILDPMVARGDLVRYEYEGLTFHVHAAHSRCTPDYVGYDANDRPVPFEVKGFKVHEASVLRMKVHAAARPWLRWRIYARRDGAWRVTFDSAGRRP